MKILACFKIVRDVEHLTSDELRALRDGALDLSAFKKIIGGYDEAALENALRLGDAVRAGGGKATLHAATAGECDSRFAQDLSALGFERIFRIVRENRDERSPEMAAADIVALIADQGGYDAVFMGKQASPGEHGQTPYIVAARTNLPCVAEAMDLHYCDGGIAVVSRTDLGTSSRTVVKPAVYVMGEAAHPYLRVATLREKLRAKKYVMEEFTPPPVIATGRAQFLRHIYEASEKSCVFIEGDTLNEKVDTLWHDYLRKAVMS